MLLLVAVGGIWLLLSADDDDSATESPAASVSASQETSDEPAPSSSTAEEPSSSAPPPSETVPAGDPVDVAASATAVSVGVVGASSRGPALPVLSGVVTACEVIVTLREADDDVATRSGAEVVEFDEELDGVTILSPRRAAVRISSLIPAP